MPLQFSNKNIFLNPSTVQTAVLVWLMKDRRWKLLIIKWGWLHSKNKMAAMLMLPIPPCRVGLWVTSAASVRPCSNLSLNKWKVILCTLCERMHERFLLMCSLPKRRSLDASFHQLMEVKGEHDESNGLLVLHREPLSKTCRIHPKEWAWHHVYLPEANYDTRFQQAEFHQSVLANELQAFWEVHLHHEGPRGRPKRNGGFSMVERWKSKIWTAVAVLQLQARAPEGDPLDAMEQKAGNLLQVRQVASSAPAECHTGSTEAGPAQFVSGLLSTVIADRQLPGDVQLSAAREEESSWHWGNASKPQNNLRMLHHWGSTLPTSCCLSTHLYQPTYSRANTAEFMFAKFL